MNHISGVGDKFDDEINDGRIDNMNFWGASSGHGTWFIVNWLGEQTYL